MVKVLAVLVSLVGGLRLQATPLLSPSVVNPEQFRVTQFAMGLSLPGGMVVSTNGPSLLVNTSPFFSNGQIVRLTDANRDGVADGPGTILYNGGAGPLTQLQDTGRFYMVGEFGATRFRMLAPGANPDDAFTPVGDFNFSYTPGWDHPTPGVTWRATPGQPGSIDVVFNVGSQYNDALSTDKVTVSGWGLAPTQLDGDSLYIMTVDQSGAAPVVTSAPRRIATGIRNVYGMAFDAQTGDLYFADNAIDLRTPPYEEPPQADELNRLTAAQIASGQAFDFGYPTCYVAYQTGAQVGGGCVSPLVAFQPLNGAQSEGPGDIAFAPAGFPAAYRNGIFVTFAGMGATGTANTENALVFYDLTSGQYIHFIAPGHPDMGRAFNVTASGQSLWLADFSTGTIWEISAVPEPASAGLFVIGAFAMAMMARRRKSGGVC